MLRLFISYFLIYFFVLDLSVRLPTHNWMRERIEQNIHRLYLTYVLSIISTLFSFLTTDLTQFWLQAASTSHQLTIILIIAFASSQTARMHFAIFSPQSSSPPPTALQGSLWTSLHLNYQRVNLAKKINRSFDPGVIYAQRRVTSDRWF